MVVTAAVFQLPMFWLNADAPENACESRKVGGTPDPTAVHTAAQKALRAGLLPCHSPAPYIALQCNDAASGASSHSLVEARHHLQI